MKNKISKIAIGCCAVFFCAGSVYGTVDLTGVPSIPSCTSSCHDFAAFNIISGNATFSGGPYAQVMLADGNQMVDYGDLSLGTLWGTWGHNNTLPSTTTALLVGIFSGSVNIQSVDKNWWGSGINPFSLLPNPPTSAQFTVQYLATTGHVDPALNTGASDFSCSGYTSSERIKTKGNQALSMNPIQAVDSCTRLKAWEAVKPQDAPTAKLQYDTLRMYIEKCAVTDPQSYFAFNSLNGAVQLYSDDTTRFDTYRNWLLSVLYLNTTQPYYFCDCLGSIAGTYQYGKYKPLGYLAVLNYARHYHPECWNASSDQEYSQDSLYDAQNGYDASHLPSLDSMGLGFLLHNQAVTPTVSGLGTPYLASFTSSPNPFNKETTLEFTLNRMTYTTIAVYDELGRLVWGDGRGSSLEAGEHTIHLDASNFPSGTLYARISTGFGEVKTVKLIHEK